MWWARLLNIVAGLLNGAGAPASTNSYESISTVTVGAGGASSISFTSIPSTYKHLQIRFMNITASWTVLEINGDTGANYKGHELRGSGATANAYVSPDVNDILAVVGSQSTSYPSIGVIDVLDYQNTNKYKTVRALGGGDANGSGYVDLTSGLWMNTNAITSIKVLGYGASNLLQYSSIALYGIKG